MSKRSPKQQHNAMVKSVVGEPWLMLPDRLDEIRELIETTARGESIDDTINRVYGFGGDEEEEGEDSNLIDGVKIIPLQGVIMPRMSWFMRYMGGTSSMAFASEVMQATTNDSVKTILIAVDSPGGAYTYTPEARQALKDAMGVKRVVTSATNSMASGAYWLGTTAHKVYASESTSVGSIGVYSVYRDYVKMAEEEGIAFNILQAGTLKTAGAPEKHMSTKERAYLQSRIDDIYGQFIEAVADSRSVESREVTAKYGDGGTFLAKEAQSIGMIDEVAILEEVLDQERRRPQVYFDW